MEQQTIEWFRARLGNFTGSKVGDLMKSGKGKDNLFGDAAKTYIYSVAAERSMNPAIVNDDELFRIYLDQVNTSNKAMRWGNEQEENAREYYERITGFATSEVGSCKHPSIEHFASSPDGIVDEIGCIEIKCPGQEKFMRYCDQVKDNESLLSVEPKYFYQCQAHMMCTGVEWCDFVVYNPFQLDLCHIVRIAPDAAVFTEIEKRINEANRVINQIINK